MTNKTDSKEVQVQVEKHCKDLFSLHFSSTDERIYANKDIGSAIPNVLTLDTQSIQALYDANTKL